MRVYNAGPPLRRACHILDELKIYIWVAYGVAYMQVLSSVRSDIGYFFYAYTIDLWGSHWNSLNYETTRRIFLHSENFVIIYSVLHLENILKWKKKRKHRGE